jgi:hypothetical protein
LELPIGDLGKPGAAIESHSSGPMRAGPASMVAPRLPM